MPNIDLMKTSNYLKKEDVGEGVKVTIREVKEANIAKEGEKIDLKWIIYFYEFDKPLVSNVTHREQIAAYLHSRNSDDWGNKQVELWNDPSVTFGGNIGGIRIRPVSQQAQHPLTKQPQDMNVRGFQQNPNERPYHQTDEPPPDYEHIPGFDQ